MDDAPRFTRALGERSYGRDHKRIVAGFAKKPGGVFGSFAVTLRALLDKPAVAPFSVIGKKPKICWEALLFRYEHC